jgi:tRNA pseudouridine38-40 synthase
MPTFKLTLAYDGTEFSGWQAQPGQRTVQGALEAAWREITGESVRAAAASRTDAGVHALGQVVSVPSASRLSAGELFGGINAKLPTDVVLMNIEEAPPEFHATRDARRKRYRYQIHNDRRRPLFERDRVWHVSQQLDVAAMHRAGQSLVGEHDFASFQSTGSERETTVRTVFAVEVASEPNALASGSLVRIEVEGDGFLYNMVRIIAGTLVEAGTGLRDERSLGDVLAACDRRAAGKTAPPQGLVLLRVAY